MPRPTKLRNVCSLPNNCHFGPLDKSVHDDEIINMTVDEYETIRLIDLDGCTQEECAKQMNVARTTVQGIYNDARRKLAEFVVNGKRLKIQGGEYKICNKQLHGCRRACCKKDTNNEIIENTRENKNMRIAIPADENNKESAVCISYGRAPYFVIYDVDKNEYKFVDNSVAANSGGAGIIVSQMLVDEGVGVVLTPRLGQNAADVLNAGNIRIMKTNDQNISENIRSYLKGELKELDNIHPGFHNHGVN